MVQSMSLRLKAEAFKLRLEIHLNSLIHLYSVTIFTKLPVPL